MEYSQGCAEVRRLHIVYFLSRNGLIEHPHLIRVHHLSRNGVHLRDVKRWLAELRGKDMPQYFAWSYKRTYKSGHVWQDLLDDDLITPISDNEYILKGSEIFPRTSTQDISYAERKVPMQNKLPSLEEEAEDKKPSEIQNQSETSTDVSTKSFSEIEEESTIFGSETSTLKDYSGKLEVEKKHSDKTSKQDIIHDQQDQYFKMDNKMKNKVKIEKIDSPASSMKSSESCITKGTSRSTGRSHKLRNLLTCGALDANDSAHVVMINRHNNQNNVHLMEMCKLGEKHIGGSQRISRTTWNQQPWNTGSIGARKSCDGVKDSTKNIGEFCNQRTTRATYKHVKGPNCSQCKKQFKPEKLHAHMKSCKGIKATEKTSQRSI